MKPVRLYMVVLSTPSHCVRIALELKGIAHEVRRLTPGAHPALLRALGFRGTTVPAVRFADGRRLQHSIAILRELDRLVPDPPLLPADPDLRAAVLEAEAWGERELQVVPRALFRWVCGRDAGARKWLGELAGTPLPGLGARTSGPLARRLAKLAGGDDAGVRDKLQRLPGLLDHVDDLLARGVIGGERLNAADLQIGTNVREMLTVPQLRPLVEGRAAAAHALRVQPVYDADELPGTFPAEWVPARSQ